MFISPSQKTQYFLVTSLVLISARASVLFANKVFLISLLVISMYLYTKYKKGPIRIRYILIYYFFWLSAVLFKFNTSILSPDQFITYSGFYTVILASYFIIMTVDDFFNKLVKVIYILSLISLPLYVLQLLIPNILFDINNILYKISPSFFSIGGDSYSNSIVFTIYKRHILRNCGFSWEPGAFGFLLTLSLLIYLTIKKDKKIDKTIVVLVIAIITTLSTTAYIGLMISMIYYYFNLNNTKKNIIYFIVYVPAFIIIINQPFVYDKIENTYDIETNDLQVTRMRNFSSSQGEMYTPSRFASLIIDYRDFVKDPILGRGLNKETRFSSESENVNFANGLSNLLVKFGIIGFLLYFYFLSKSIKKLSIEYDKKYYFIILMGIIAIGFSEPLLESPLLFSIQYYFFKKR